MSHLRLRRASLAVITAALVGLLLSCGNHLGTGTTGRSVHHAHETHPAVPARRDLLGINVNVNFSDGSSGGNALALAKPVSSGPGLREILSGVPYATLLQHYQGAAIGDLHVDVVLTGASTSGLLVTNIQVAILDSRREPLSGTFLPIAHQSTPAATEYLVDMNAPDPVLRRSTGPYSRKAKRGAQTFPDGTIMLNPGEQQVVGIDFLASRGYFACRLKFTYQIGTQVFTETRGMSPESPFAVTGRASRYAVRYKDVAYAGLQLAG